MTITISDFQQKYQSKEISLNILLGDPDLIEDDKKKAKSIIDKINQNQFLKALYDNDLLFFSTKNIDENLGKQDDVTVIMQGKGAKDKKAAFRKAVNIDQNIFDIITDSISKISEQFSKIKKNPLSQDFLLTIVNLLIENSDPKFKGLSIEASPHITEDFSVANYYRYNSQKLELCVINHGLQTVPIMKVIFHELSHAIDDLCHDSLSLKLVLKALSEARIDSDNEFSNIIKVAMKISAQDKQDIAFIKSYEGFEEPVRQYYLQDSHHKLIDFLYDNYHNLLEAEFDLAVLDKQAAIDVIILGSDQEKASAIKDVLLILESYKDVSLEDKEQIQKEFFEKFGFQDINSLLKELDNISKGNYQSNSINLKEVENVLLDILKSDNFSDKASEKFNPLTIYRELIYRKLDDFISSEDIKDDDNPQLKDIIQLYRKCRIANKSDTIKNWYENGAKLGFRDVATRALDHDSTPSEFLTFHVENLYNIFLSLEDGEGVEQFQKKYQEDLDSKILKIQNLLKKQGIVDKDKQNKIIGQALIIVAASIDKYIKTITEGRDNIVFAQCLMLVPQILQKEYKKQLPDPEFPEISAYFSVQKVDLDLAIDSHIDNASENPLHSGENVRKLVAQEVLESIVNYSYYYNHYALNTSIEHKVTIDHQTKLIPLGEDRNLLENLKKYATEKVGQILIPIHLGAEAGNSRDNQHFTGLYLRLENEEYVATYIDPIGAEMADKIPDNIMQALQEIGIKSIVRVSNIIQSYSNKEEFMLDNVHCGAFTGFILSELAIGENIRVSGNDLQINIDNSWVSLSNLNSEDSNKLGESIRRRDFQSLSGMTIDEDPIILLKQIIVKKQEQVIEFDMDSNSKFSGKRKHSPISPVEGHELKAATSGILEEVSGSLNMIDEELKSTKKKVRKIDKQASQEESRTKRVIQKQGTAGKKEQESDIFQK